LAVLYYHQLLLKSFFEGESFHAFAVSNLLQKLTGMLAALLIICTLTSGHFFFPVPELFLISASYPGMHATTPLVFFIVIIDYCV
jgi:hypothetical protein